MAWFLVMFVNSFLLHKKYMKVLKPILLALMFLYFTDVNSQIKNFEFSGYLSGLHSTGYDDVYDDWSSFNKINNRVNLQFWASSDFTIKLEVQNRLYNGSYLSRFPEFSSSPSWQRCSCPR
jgi:hypothetical protein